jgi:hypothetical protein
MSTEAHRLAEIVRSKDPLDKLCKERLITPEGCDWLKSALDPFHDFQLDNLKGYPDISTEPTVVVKVRQSKTISAPPGLATGATWDCHIALSPVDYAGCAGVTSTIRGVRAQPGYSADAGRIDYVLSEHGGSPLTGRMDGLMINSVPNGGTNGEDMTFTPGHCPATAGLGYEMQGIRLDDFIDFTATDLGVYRLVYSGFEVVNTTAQIAKQGSVTVYEYGNSYEMASKHEGDRNSNPLSEPNTWFRCPPNTLAEAKIMPGAHTWAAQDGCYNTAKFQTDNPFQSATERNFSFSQNEDMAGIYSGYLLASPAADAKNYGSFVSCNNMASDPPSTPTIVPSTHFSRMNTTGAYFTGLSNSSTLFVTWRVGIERLPAANKPMFLALAQPSAAYDPNALVLYNLVANALPPGCPQGYNDMGKWFSWIAERAKSAIPTVYPIVRTAALLAGAMGRPIIGGALGSLATSMKPVAEDMAVRRLQGAARRRARSGNGQQSGKQPAVGNYTKPSPRGQVKGGTNGLR